MTDKLAPMPEIPNTPEVFSSGFNSPQGFGLILQQANYLSESTLVPDQFRKNVPNVVIALEIASRMQASPLAVMQNLYIVHGKPGWSAQFIIAAINSTGKFSPLRFDLQGSGDGRSCAAWAVEKATGEKLVGPAVSIEMAKKEGWTSRNGSKWQTMSEMMLRYRAATFFGRLYAPEILMGMHTTDEIVEISDADFRVVKEEEANQGEVVEIAPPVPEPVNEAPASPAPEAKRGRQKVIYQVPEPAGGEFGAPMKLTPPPEPPADANRNPGF